MLTIKDVEMIKKNGVVEVYTNYNFTLQDVETHVRTLKKEGTNDFYADEIKELMTALYLRSELPECLQDIPNGAKLDIDFKSMRAYYENKFICAVSSIVGISFLSLLDANSKMISPSELLNTISRAIESEGLDDYTIVNIKLSNNMYVTTLQKGSDTKVIEVSATKNK